MDYFLNHLLSLAHWHSLPTWLLTSHIVINSSERVGELCMMDEIPIKCFIDFLYSHMSWGPKSSNSQNHYLECQRLVKLEAVISFGCLF